MDAAGYAGDCTIAASHRTGRARRPAAYQAVSREVLSGAKTARLSTRGIG